MNRREQYFAIRKRGDVNAEPDTNGVSVEAAPKSEPESAAKFDRSAAKKAWWKAKKAKDAIGT